MGKTWMIPPAYHCMGVQGRRVLLCFGKGMEATEKGFAFLTKAEKGRSRAASSLASQWSHFLPLPASPIFGASGKCRCAQACQTTRQAKQAPSVSRGKLLMRAYHGGIEGGWRTTVVPVRRERLAGWSSFSAHSLFYTCAVTQSKHASEIRHPATSRAPPSSSFFFSPARLVGGFPVGGFPPRSRAA